MICGIMEHEKLVFTQVTAPVLPPHTLSEDIVSEIRKVTVKIAKELKVVGYLTFSLRLRKGHFILEVNRAHQNSTICQQSGGYMGEIAAKP